MKNLFKTILIVVVLSLLTTRTFAQGEANNTSGANLSTKEKVAFAEKAVGQLDGATKKILHMIEDAQKAKNIMLLNCLNEKLGAIRGLLKIAEDAAFGLSEAIARDNADLQEHNFRKVAIGRNQGLVVAAEADACIGDGAGAIGGGTRVVVTVEGDGDEGGLSDFGASPGGSTRAPDTYSESVYTIVFKNADGETKKLYLTLTTGGPVE